MLNQPVFDVDVNKVLNDWDRRRMRSRQVKTGASELGTCRRRLAYRLARQKPDNFTDKGQAIMGTIAHVGILAALRKAHGGTTEVKLEDDDVRGSADWLRFDPLGLAICSDVKTKGSTYEQSIRQPITRPHLWQLSKYADLLRRGCYQKRERRLREPVDVVDIEVLTINRENGRSHSRRLPFDQAIADEATAWQQEVKDRLERDGINRVPRDQAGPDSGANICANCPFLNACWGPQDSDGVRPALDLPRDDLREHLIGYEEHRLVESEAKKRKELHRAHLNGQDPFKLSDGWELAWKGGKVTTVTEPDIDAVLEIVERAGLVIPMRTVDKVGTRSISVKPPKQTTK